MSASAQARTHARAQPIESALSAAVAHRRRLGASRRARCDAERRSRRSSAPRRRTTVRPPLTMRAGSHRSKACMSWRIEHDSSDEGKQNAPAPTSPERRQSGRLGVVEFTCMPAFANRAKTAAVWERLHVESRLLFATRMKSLKVAVNYSWHRVFDDLEGSKADHVDERVYLLSLSRSVSLKLVSLCQYTKCNLQCRRLYLSLAFLIPVWMFIHTKTYVKNESNKIMTQPPNYWRAAKQPIYSCNSIWSNIAFSR